MRLSASHASHPLPPGRFQVLISVRGWVDPRAIVQLEGLGQLKNPMTACPHVVSGQSKFNRGLAIAQTVSRWLPTAAAPVRARVWSGWICGGQSGAGAGFLRVLRFPLPIFIPPNSPSSHSPGAGTIGQYMADVPSGPSLDSTPPLCELKKIQLTW
jgi:hypothetical protein